MYVETMTLEQVKREIETGIRQTGRKVAEILGGKQYRRACLNLGPEEKRFFKRIDYTHSGIGFHVIPWVAGKHDYKRNGMNSVLFVTFMYKGRLWAAMPTNFKATTFFIPHFFYRYAERNGLDTEGIIDTMTRFFKTNSIGKFNDYEHEGYEDSVFVSFCDGSGFGTKYGDYVVFKTFVRDDMLFKDQIGIHDKCSWEREVYIMNKAV